ncbi:enoyl-CoA hydratase/isomerase family protein [Nesterenkonia sp. PF2B19]|uniref:enoyl-CoA hydratase/isomerase family protein n=1 Tax=unclassified Nesterenkonia TaxID=2629769 RepID=UPI0009F39F0D|nr:enoyl-CoA hydratase-related protein [Nesterenkonia sp. PF2B19]OSM44049.1 enoyl-CoA hydratase [Nesterenkonia sp. PF2B19]
MTTYAHESTRRVGSLILDVDDGIGTITVDRPEVRNALDSRVLQQLADAVEELRWDDAVRVIVFTGAGEKAFVAGADINELARRTPEDGLRATMQRFYTAVEAVEKPTIAAVNGYAFGGGLELALACDIRIASTAARFALPETGLGIIPAAGGTQRLARLIGAGRATEMILTGRRLDADEALQAGLVTAVVEPDGLLEEARRTAAQIMARGPLAVQLATTIIRHGLNADAATGMLLERLAQSVLYSTGERAEGTGAFLEKRTPDYSAHQVVQPSRPTDSGSPAASDRAPEGGQE